MDAPGISAASLRQSLASTRPPLVIDVRRNERFREAPDLVRGADTGRPDLAPQCAGLAAVSLGLSRLYADDHEMHTWNPEAYK